MTTENPPDQSLEQRIQALERVISLERELRRQLEKRVSQTQQPSQASDEKPGAAPSPPIQGDATSSSRTPTVASSATQGNNTRSRAPAPPLPTGFNLHEYRIDGLLGQGGFGITYLATDVNLNTAFAVKEYLPTDFAYRASDRSVVPRTAEDQEFYQSWLDSFLAEARALATFKHRNIVRVARFFEAHQTAYMVLEYERGKSLKEWWSQHKNIAEKDLVALVHPLLDGLATVHAAGYLHRDIKPDNIYVRSDDGSLVLLDFGSAKRTVGDEEDMNLVFTPGFAPIEQYAGGKQGPWTDIYAFGATLYWMIAGKKPPPAPARNGMVDELVPAATVGADRYSPEFLRAIDWSLKIDPEERPQTVHEFCRALFGAHAGTLGLIEALNAGESDGTPPSLVNDWRQWLDPKHARRRLNNFLKATLHPPAWPLVVKMATAMVLAALLPMLITAYYNLHGGIASTSISELRNLERLAESTAGRISQLITDNRNMAKYLGTDKDFIAYLTDPTPALKEAIDGKLKALLTTNPDVRLLSIMDAEGTIVASSDSSVIGKNFKYRDYFKESVAGRSYMTGIIVGSDATPGIYYSNPVLDTQQKAIGLVLLRIKGDTVEKILSIVDDASGRTPFLIDGDGVLVQHTQKNLLYKSLAPLSADKMQQIVADQRFRRNQIESLNMPNLAQTMVNAKAPGNIKYTSTITQEDEIAGYAPVPGTNWVVGVTESLTTFEEPLNRLFLNVLYSVVVVGIVFLFFAVMFARSLIRPIVALTDAAEALKSGDYEKANIQVTSRDEIGKLARTFKIMIDVLRQRERERKIVK